MSVYQVIKDVASKRSISIRRIEIDLGISNGTIGKWDKSMPAADNLQAVADYLNVTSSFILNEARKNEVK